MLGLVCDSMPSGRLNTAGWPSKDATSRAVNSNGCARAILKPFGREVRSPRAAGPRLRSAGSANTKTSTIDVDDAPQPVSATARVGTLVSLRQLIWSLYGQG